MSATEYLIGRGWPSAWKISAVLTSGTVLLWFNLKSGALTPGWLAGMLGGGLGSVLGGGLAFGAAILAGATVLGIVLLAPLYAISRCTRLFRLWTRQRVIEEMLCTGMSGSAVLDRAALFTVGWWGVVVLPSILVGLSALPSLRLALAPTSVLGYLLSLAALFYVGTFVTLWTGLCPAKLKLPLLGAVLGLQALPLLALTAGGISGPALLGGLLYAAIVARCSSILTLEHLDALQHLEQRIARALGRRVGSPSGVGWENPIAARQAMRGPDPAELVARGLIALGFVLTLLAGAVFDGIAFFGTLLVAVVLFNSYRAAKRMSGIVLEEIEGSTLEALRSTPMGSEQFLKGWLQAVLRPLFWETSALLAGVGLSIAALGHASALGSRWVVTAVALCFALPLVAAYVGASAAGQAQSGAETSGRLLLSFGTFVVAATPQVLVLTQFVSLPISLAGLAVTTALLCWLLDSAAKKSLDKVFLSQNE